MVFFLISAHQSWSLSYWYWLKSWQQGDFSVPLPWNDWTRANGTSSHYIHWEYQGCSFQLVSWDTTEGSLIIKSEKWPGEMWGSQRRIWSYSILQTDDPKGSATQPLCKAHPWRMGCSRPLHGWTSHSLFGQSVQYYLTKSDMGKLLLWSPARREADLLVRDQSQVQTEIKSQSKLSLWVLSAMFWI